MNKFWLVLPLNPKNRNPQASVSVTDMTKRVQISILNVKDPNRKERGQWFVCLKLPSTWGEVD